MVAKEQIRIINGGLSVLAPAKINLCLLIAGPRPDGFHEIETVMAKVDFYDQILIEPGIKAGIELLRQGPYWAPDGKDNLVYQACEMLLNSCGQRPDIKIILTKNIPAGSGLGSASSDAAATLIALNKYLDLQLSNGQLAELAQMLGSDVPFFLDGPLALCTGKGEKIKKLDEILNFSALLLLPDISVSTKKVYANYKHDRPTYEKLTARINSYIKKNRIDLVSKMCANMLQNTCFGLYKELGDLKKKVESLSLGPLCLSGSGSAMYFIFRSTDGRTAKECRHELEQKIGCKTLIVSNNRW